MKIREKELKQISDGLLYKDISESGLLKAEYKQGYNQGVVEMAECISRILFKIEKICPECGREMQNATDWWICVECWTKIAK